MEHQGQVLLHGRHGVIEGAAAVPDSRSELIEFPPEHERATLLRGQLLGVRQFLDLVLSQSDEGPGARSFQVVQVPLEGTSLALLGHEHEIAALRERGGLQAEPKPTQIARGALR